MLDLEAAKQRQHEYYASLPTDTQGINSIEKFAFSDSALVPELFQNFAVEYFNLERFRRVDLDSLNAALNELWDGPGSCARISDAIWDIRIARRADPSAAVKDVFKGLETPTIDSELALTPDED